MSRESALNLVGAPVVPAVDALPLETPAPPALDSDRFAALAKKESKFQAERELFKKEREEALRLKSEADEIKKQFQSFSETKAKDPIIALKQLGFSETDIFNFMAAQEKPEPTPEELARKVAQEELARYEQAQAKLRKEAEEALELRTIQSDKAEIGDALKLAAEKFPFCADDAEKSAEFIYAIKQQVKQTEGVSLTFEEAADLAENFFVEDFERKASLRKPKIEEPKVEEKVVSEEVKKAVQPMLKPKTLTNQAAPTITSTIPKRESREEKRARLENLLRGIKV